ncbi:PAS domain-containing protein [Aestuariivirga sp.]|uniref:PAS domain-containing protein n=1 Tax=Aestuariivirga sp. TaxID=2650926 RepID=UPI003BACF694
MLLNVWRALRQDRSAPQRQDLDLKQLQRLVPYLFIAEQTGAAGGFTWRLAGTGVCSFVGRELTGKDVLAGWDRFERGVLSTLLTGVITGHRQAAVRLRFRTDRGQTEEAEMLALPMTSFDGSATHVLGGLFPQPSAGTGHYMELVPLELSTARFLDADAGLLAAATKAAQATRKFRMISGGLEHG